MSISLKRATVVTGALAVTGFVCGAGLGTVVLTGMVVRELGFHGVVGKFPEIALVGMGYGGAVGAVLTPPLSWLLLRRVSLGRAIFETALGVLLGTAAGLAFAPVYTIQAALVGFVLAALRLRIARGSRRQVGAGQESEQLSP